jgi:hypothetical protein
MYPKIQLALWMVHPVLELALAVTMILRGLHRKFPVFLSYLLFEFVAFAILFPMRHQLAPYFYGYWSSAMISLVLGFMVIHEVFTDVFRPYHTLRDLGTVLFKWAALVMIFVAVVVAVASPAGKSPLMQAVSTVQRCVRTIQCGLILFLLFFTRYLGVSWRKYSFGLALGFGSYAAVELASNALIAGGQVRTPFVGLCNTVMYSFSLMIWFGYSFLKAPASAQAQAGLLASQRWEESLSDLHRPAPADSLIPMFEGMVDRAFSHTSFENEQEPAVSEAVVAKPVPMNPVRAALSMRRAASQR